VGCRLAVVLRTSVLMLVTTVLANPRAVETPAPGALSVFGVDDSTASCARPSSPLCGGYAVSVAREVGLPLYDSSKSCMT
jgi:hypothetical protein